MFLLLSTAFAGALGVSATAPASLYVDGKPLNVAVGEKPAWLELPGSGSHVVAARTSSDKPITSLDVVVPDGFEVTVEYRDRHFAVTGIAADKAQPQAAAIVPGATVTVSANGTSVTVGGLGVSVTTPAPSPAPAPPPAPVSTAPVQVQFASTDGEWADLYVDGEKRQEFRVGTAPVVLSLTPGMHKVEIKDFMGSETWASGHLNVSGTTEIKLGFGKTSGVEVYNLPGAWGK